MNNMFDILELCLQEVENGADLEAVLSRYPEHTEELRPLLMASVHARQMAVAAPSDEMMQRNRAKALQRAAQLREQRVASKRKPTWALGRWAVAAFALFALMLFSALNVLHASAQALPGDGLYPVKRWWEQVRVSVTVGEEARSRAAGEIENERLREIDQLFALSVSTRVDFAGVVTSQRGDAWQVAGISVFVTDQTELPGEPVQVGAAVRVYGITRTGFVVAERVEFLPVNSALPGSAPMEEPSATPMPISTRTIPRSATGTPSPTVTPSPSSTVTPPIAPGNTNGNSNTGQNNNSNGKDNDNDDDDDDNDNGN